MRTLIKLMVAIGAWAAIACAPAAAAELGKTTYWMVFSNPVDGREKDYNDWYVGMHMKDISGLPGVLNAQFFHVDENAPPQKGNPVYRYLIIYEVRSDAVAEINARMAKGLNMQLGARPGDVVIDFSQTKGTWYKPITNLVSKEEMVGKSKEQMLEYARKPR